MALFNSETEEGDLIAMKPTRIRYMRRFNLENYNHEELEVEYSLEDGDGKTAKDALLAARKDIAECSTAYLKAQREKQAGK